MFEDPRTCQHVSIEEKMLMNGFNNFLEAVQIQSRVTRFWSHDITPIIYHIE
jgi:hypothetical protein